MRATERSCVEYVCGKCNRAHGRKDNAESCCLCPECGKREAIHDAGHRSWIDKVCGPCKRRADLARIRGAIKRLEATIESRHAAVRDLEKELESLRCEFVLVKGGEL